MLRRAAHIFAPLRVDRQPWITRQSYLHERTASLTLPVAMAMVEGSVVGVLARLTFRIPDLYIAVLVASPMFANLTSFVWARLARGRPKVRLINLMQAAMLLCVGAVALLPTPPAATDPTPSLTLGQAGLVALVVAARCLWTGVVTLRSTVWRMNYPRHVRAQVTGRLALLFTLVTGVAAYGGFSLFDASPGLFRVVYPLAMVIGILGVWAFSKVRLRRERELLAYERLPAPSRSASRATPHGTPAPIYEYDPKPHTGDGDPSPTTRDNFWTVLRNDPLYRRYMLWQFVGGSANLMTETVIIFLVTDLLAGLRGQYQISVALTTVIPQIIAVITLPLWARWMDRVHIAEFRAKQGWVWVFNQASLWAAAVVGAWTGSPAMTLALLILPRIGQGIARGAGMLAWNLGHNDFADRRLVPLYMGIHVTLTGIRGAAAPLIAVLLWSGWNDVSLLGFAPRTLIGPFDGIGVHLFILTTILAIAAERGFKSLHHHIQATTPVAAA